MTITIHEIGLYAGAMAALFITPGPVWAGLVARALAGGFAAAWPLACGVLVGDFLWPFLAIIGASSVLALFDTALSLLKLLAAAMFFWMGCLALRNPGKVVLHDSRLTAPGMHAGFVAGIAIILGNPKAILFYLGVLPGLFDLSRLTAIDIAIIVALSMLIPFAGNLAIARFVSQARGVIRSTRTLRLLNIIAGTTLIGVGLAVLYL